jgi:hypothetical protein
VDRVGQVERDVDGYDRTKRAAMVSVAAGALFGGFAGLEGARFTIREACARPDAGNLCGLMPSYFVPGFVVIGAVVGACLATVAVVIVVGRMKA